MNAWIALIIGFVLGLLAKWAYDNFLGGQETKSAGQEEELRARLTALEGENKELRLELDQQPKVVVKEKDRLEKIKGVGPVFANRFNEAGIYTFAELATVTPEQAHDIIKPQEWQAIDPENWITEAQNLASAEA